MTLQNKKIGLLNNTQKDTSSDEVLDLFDQYGSDEEAFVVSQDTVVPADHDITRPKLDDEPELEIVEKSWEQNTEFESPKQKITTVIPPKAVAQESDKIDAGSFKRNNEPASEVSTVVRSKRDYTKSIVEPPKVEIKKPETQKQVIKKSVPKPQTDKPLRVVKIDPSKKTIMIVDDDIDTLEMYADVFENADYNIIRAADGLEALSLLSKHTPHIIFTGISMPKMDGFAMMEALAKNKRTASIPVVINSHLGRETDKEKAEALGARDFIIRGFTQPREVLERVGALLLKSDYIFNFDVNDKGARLLAQDLGMPNFLRCPHGQKMALKLNITDEKDLSFAARFSCIDVPKDKK